MRKRKRSAVDSDTGTDVHPEPRYNVKDRVQAEFIERLSGDDGRFWAEGTVRRVTKTGIVTVRFDDGMVEKYTAHAAAEELRPGDCLCPPLPTYLLL